MGNKPLITDELLPGGVVKQGDNILGLMSAGWTNERHSTYISSMEASFVDQLYGFDKHGIDARSSHFGGNGIKVLKENACKNIRFEGPNGDRSALPENLWVRRFRPRDTGVNCHGDRAEDSGDDYGSGTDTVREKFRMHGRDVKGFDKETLIEVSDQNFSEEKIDVEANDEPYKKRKPTSTSRAIPNDKGT